MQPLSSDTLNRAVIARMGISFIFGLERILRVAINPSIPGNMMSMRIRWVFFDGFRHTLFTRTTERPVRERGDECSELPAREAPQNHGRKSVVRGLP